ncbi:glycosyltransferase [Sulfuracidifex metallicus]|uniref:glycosyltransferase n=1 Tax=Sulfuracidifex metallicus TaxID=47303 RepID=UPI0023F0D00D|nr:glycosyltransferase [Sulfuracidifex metallicus]
MSIEYINDMDEAFSLLSITYFLILFLFARSPVKQPQVNRYSSKDVTVVIPVYREDEGLFLDTIKSVASQGVRFVVIGDGCSFPYKEITSVLGGEFLEIPHSGKRRALAEGVKRVRTPLVLLLDSDTVVEQGGIENLASKFDDSIGGITPLVEELTTSNSSVYLISKVLSFFRKLNNRVLSKNGGIMVLNGQCSLFKTDVILPFITSQEFLRTKEGFIGDDREITIFLKEKGYKVVQDEDVRVFTTPPRDFHSLFKQMARWFRAGYYYYVQELKRKVTPNPIYYYVLSYWYLLPILLTIEYVYTGFDLGYHLIRTTEHILERQGNLGLPILSDLLAFKRALVIFSVRLIKMAKSEVTSFDIFLKLAYFIVDLTFLGVLISSMKTRIRDSIYVLSAFPVMFVSSLTALLSVLSSTLISSIKRIARKEMNT